MNTIAFVTGAAILGMIVPGIALGISRKDAQISILQWSLCSIGFALLAYGARG